VSYAAESVRVPGLDAAWYKWAWEKTPSRHPGE
jgi:hypothetical protein